MIGWEAWLKAEDSYSLGSSRPPGLGTIQPWGLTLAVKGWVLLLGGRFAVLDDFAAPASAQHPQLHDARRAGQRYEQDTEDRSKQ